MSEVAISVEGLSKQFRIGSAERYRTLRDTLTETMTAPFRLLRNGRPVKAAVETIWALKDVSFDVKRGEVIGIIGRNGAGKSTLLKILSRITEPTHGHAEIHGRVGSLLEVGTGFHPELTGRENIFLNGAILGMKRAEILRKFDEIVAFAEVEKFIDTPVKHYSSGMYMRLAFAVAAHMDTENLIVDEVLAVGDQKFQDKCLNKMSAAGKQGRTVIYVSHSMPSIQRLCQRVLILEQGRLKLDVAPRFAIAEYLNKDVGNDYYAPPSGKPTITAAKACVENGTVIISIEFVSPFTLAAIVGFIIYDPTGAPVFGTNGRMDSRARASTPQESGRVTIFIPSNFLRPNRYLVSLWLADSYSDHCALEKVIHFDLDNSEPNDLPPEIVGCVNIPVEWKWQESVQRNDFQLAARPEVA